MSVKYFFQDTFDSTKTNLWTNIMHTFKWHTGPIKMNVTYLRDICPIPWIFFIAVGTDGLMFSVDILMYQTMILVSKQMFLRA